MRPFEVCDETVADFVGRVRVELNARDIGDYVSIDGDDRQLTIRFRWLGRSELRYRVEPTATGFRARIADTRMSPFHAPFRERFENRFEEVLVDLGARPIEV